MSDLTDISLKPKRKPRLGSMQWEKEYRMEEVKKYCERINTLRASLPALQYGAARDAAQKLRDMEEGRLSQVKALRKIGIGTHIFRSDADGKDAAIFGPVNPE